MKTPTGAVTDASVPLTAQKLADGEVSVGQVEAIRKFVTSLAHLESEKVALAEQLLVDRAAEDDPAALRRYVERWVRNLVDPHGTAPNDDEPAQPERELKRRTYRDGRMEFRGRSDAETVAPFEELLAPFEKRKPDDPRGYAERAGDAFADVLQKAANRPDLTTHNGLKTEVATSLDTLQQAMDHTILPGTTLTAREARRLACDAHNLPAVMGGDSKPLDVAVPTYVVPAHIRRALVLRDKGCAFPSCDKPASVTHSHHIHQLAHRRTNTPRQPGAAVRHPPPTHRAP